MPRRDFGPSIKLRGRTVASVIVEGMKTSVKPGLITAGTALVPGAVAALRRNKIVDLRQHT